MAELGFGVLQTCRRYRQQGFRRNKAMDVKLWLEGQVLPLRQDDFESAPLLKSTLVLHCTIKPQTLCCVHAHAAHLPLRGHLSWPCWPCWPCSFLYRRRRVESAATDEPLVAAADVSSPTGGAKASGCARMQSRWRSRAGSGKRAFCACWHVRTFGRT